MFEAMLSPRRVGESHSSARIVPSLWLAVATTLCSRSRRTGRWSRPFAPSGRVASVQRLADLPVPSLLIAVGDAARRQANTGRQGILAFRVEPLSLGRLSPPGSARHAYGGASGPSGKVRIIPVA